MSEDKTQQKASTETEQVSVAGENLIATIQALLREAAVRKITVQDKTGRTLIEFPLYAGVIGVFFIGSWTVLALIAAWFAEVSILIERDVASDGEPSVAARKVEQAAGGVSESARSAASSVKSTAAAAVGGAARGASGMARRAADSLEGRLAAASEAAGKAAQGQAATEPRQCAAMTKAGARCKRTALAGSDYCSTHQPSAN